MNKIIKRNGDVMSIGRSRKQQMQTNLFVFNFFPPNFAWLSAKLYRFFFCVRTETCGNKTEYRQVT